MSNEMLASSMAEEDLDFIRELEEEEEELLSGKRRPERTLYGYGGTAERYGVSRNYAATGTDGAAGVYTTSVQHQPSRASEKTRRGRAVAKPETRGILDETETGRTERRSRDIRMTSPVSEPAVTVSAASETSAAPASVQSSGSSEALK